jgi:hypothetical protein
LVLQLEGLGVRLTTPHRKNKLLYENSKEALDLDGFLGFGNDYNKLKPDTGGN